jgi:hypothetical protein
MCYSVTWQEQHCTQWTVQTGQVPAWRRTVQTVKHHDYFTLCTMPSLPWPVNQEVLYWKPYRKTSGPQPFSHSQVCKSRVRVSPLTLLISEPAINVLKFSLCLRSMSQGNTRKVELNSTYIMLAVIKNMIKH